MSEIETLTISVDNQIGSVMAPFVIQDLGNGDCQLRMEAIKEYKHIKPNSGELFKLMGEKLVKRVDPDTGEILYLEGTRAKIEEVYNETIARAILGKFT